MTSLAGGIIAGDGFVRPGVRIVARGAADSPVNGIVALTERDPVRLEADVAQPSRTVDLNERPGAVAGAANVRSSSVVADFRCRNRPVARSPCLRAAACRKAPAWQFSHWTPTSRVRVHSSVPLGTEGAPGRGEEWHAKQSVTS